MKQKTNHQSSSALLLVSSLVLLSITQNAFADEEKSLRDYEASKYDNISYPGIEPIPLKQEGNNIDERSLWRLLSDKKYDQLNKMIKRFENTYPDWQPPADLMAAKIHGEINQAISDNNHALILQYEKDYPASFTCTDIDHMWSAGNALDTVGEKQKLFSYYQNIIANCPTSEHRLITLQRASTQLTYRSTRALIELESAHSHSNFEERKLDQFRYDFFSGWFTDAWDRKQYREAEAPAKYLQEPIIARKDTTMARLLGWWEIQRKQPLLAKNWFSHALKWQPEKETAYGLALALRDSQNFEQSKEIILQWQDQEPRMTTLFAAPTVQFTAPAAPRKTASQIALERTVKKYNRNDYSGSLKTAQVALKRASTSIKKDTKRSLQTFEAWSLYNLSEAELAADRFELLYRQQAEIDSARGLLLSSIEIREYEKVRALGAEDCGPLSFLSSTRIPSNQPNVRDEISDLYYLFYKSWIGVALKEKNFRSVELKIIRIADRIIQLEDGEMAGAAGWAYLEKGDLGSALFWFERALAWSPSADNAYGLALVKQNLGKPEEAEKLTSQWQEKSNEITLLHSDLLLERAAHEYELQNYTQSLTLAEQSAALKPSLEADKLIAWNRYQLGDREAAAKDFEKLYRNHPDKQSADGLATSLLALDKEQQLEVLANEIGGPLLDNLADHHAQQYYYKDQFVLAEHTRVSTLPLLKNIDTAAISLTPYARHRSGSEGLGQLDIIGMELAGRAFIKRHHFHVSLDFFNLDSGAVANNARLGSNADQLVNSFVFETTDKESLLIEPTLSYRYETDISPHFSIGTTPLGGELGGVLTGDLGIDWQRGQNGENKYNLKLFRKNKQESILSTSGIVDPVSGNKWGRVVDTGIQFDLHQQILNSWTLTSGALFGNLDGHEVADNDHYALWASLGYNIARNGFKYLTIGPAYRFEHFDENRSFFTYGHGGYFSPDAFHKLGGEINFQTEEAKQYIIKGRASLGYQSSSEDNAFAFPLVQTGPLLNGDDSHGVAFDSQLSAVYRVNPWIQVGAFLNVTQSPDFDDFGGGLMLRINAFDRPAVFSMDLPEAAWNE